MAGSRAAGDREIGSESGALALNWPRPGPHAFEVESQHHGLKEEVARKGRLAFRLANFELYAEDRLDDHVLGGGGDGT